MVFGPVPRTRAKDAARWKGSSGMGFVPTYAGCSCQYGCYPGVPEQGDGLVEQVAARDVWKHERSGLALDGRSDSLGVQALGR